jgi:hypothetical protein
MFSPLSGWLHYGLRPRGWLETQEADDWIWQGLAQAAKYIHDASNYATNSKILYNSSRFNNIVKTSYTSFVHNAIIPITVWQIMYSGTNILQVAITPRNSNNSQIKVNVNIPLSNHGTAASNSHCSIARSTTSFTAGQNVTTDIVPPNSGSTTGSPYGLKLFLYNATTPVNTFDSKNFTYIDNSGVVAGTTYYYAVVLREQTVASVASNIGNTSYVEITAEEIF